MRPAHGCNYIAANVLIDDCAKYLNATLAMSDEHPSSIACRIVYTILFGEYWRQPRLDERDSCVISYFTWLTIEHTIKKIAQDEGITEVGHIH